MSDTVEGNVTAATEHRRTLHEQVPAATEHRRVTEMAANVVFINMDWKASRMHNTLNRNMQLLATTIAAVVGNMNPMMICMCEVGETKNPLSPAQMQQVADKVISVWTDAATEHIQLESMFTAGAPYVAIYMAGVTGDICVHLVTKLLQSTSQASATSRIQATLRCFYTN